MPTVEVLDGPVEWAGAVFESPEDMVADEIGLTHPRWRGTPVWVGSGALYAYRKVEVAGDRHRYRYQGPWGARRHRRHEGVEDLTGWDVLVVQQELHSEDRRKLWGSPVRVYAAPPGTPRPDPAQPPEAQGWQELTRGALLRRPRAPGTGALFQEQLARLMAEGNPWVVGHWRRLADLEGVAKDAEVQRIEDEQRRMVRVARAARELQRLQPEEVRSWTSDPPFGARTTYIPMIGEDLARIRGLGEREWMALQDRVLLVVNPERDHDDDSPLYGFTKLYSPPRARPRRIRRWRPRSRAGRSWRRGISFCRGCSTSAGTSCVSVLVVRRSDCRSPAAKAGSRRVRSHGVARRRRWGFNSDGTIATEGH